MPVLGLKDAVRRIRQSCLQAERQSRPDPFFFMAGAGISFPAIPLASGIIADCRREALAPITERPGATAMELYSAWFEAAYPDLRSRQDYLRGQIKGKWFTTANLRLAHLMISGRISNLTVTTNFDDLLSRALILFGHHPVVCDHPETILKVDLDDRETPQIVQLHGSYQFYDCKNLSGEIADRASHSDASPFSMADFLDDLLNRRSPLVVGYSGWENDVFVKSLCRRLKRSLPHSLYWFCYQEAEKDRLPDVLRTHPNVFLVCPPTPDPGPAGSMPEAMAKARAGQEEDRRFRHTATEVFDALLQEFEIESPAITQNPISFFAGQLRSVLPPAGTKEPDVYFLSRTVAHLEEVDRREKDTRSAAALALDKIRDALRRADYREAVRLGAGPDLSTLVPSQLRDLAVAMFAAGVGLVDNSSDELNAYSLVVLAADRLPSGDVDLELSEQMARALFNKAVALGILGRSEEALAAYEEVVRRFGEANEPALREQVAKALFNKGVRLGALGRSEEEIAVSEEVVRRFGEATESALREQVAKALFNKGVALRESGRSEEAIAVYEEVVRRFGEANEPSLREPVAKALLNRSVMLCALGRYREAIAVSEEVVRRFGETTEPALREQLARALFSQGVALGELGRSEEEIAVYKEVVRRFGEATGAALREQVAKALFNEGVALGELGRSEEAISLYDEVVRRFGEATEPALCERVAKALTNKGVALGLLDRSQEAIAVYEEVVRRFGEATEPALRERVAWALLNKSVTLGKLGRHQDVVVASDELIRREGGAEEPAIRRLVGGGLVNKGAALRQLGQKEEAVRCLEEGVRRLQGDDDPWAKKTLAEAQAELKALLEPPEEEVGGAG